MLTFKHDHAASHPYLTAGRNLARRLHAYLLAHPALHSQSLSRGVACFLHHLPTLPPSPTKRTLPSTSPHRIHPQSIRTYLRTLSHFFLLLNHHGLLHALEPSLVLQAIFNVGDCSPMWQARPMEPQHLHNLSLSAPLWLLRFWQNATTLGARPTDLLSPLTVKHSDHAVVATARRHKTSRGGLRQPPIDLCQPPSAHAQFLVDRGHPTQPRRLFPEIPDTAFLRRITRQFLPNHHLYAGRVAFVNKLAPQVPMHQLSKLMGHANIATTEGYARSVITQDHLERVKLVQQGTAGLMGQRSRKGRRAFPHGSRAAGKTSVFSPRSTSSFNSGANPTPCQSPLLTRGPRRTCTSSLSI